MRRFALPLLGLLLLLGAPSVRAEEAGPVFTPRPPPTALPPRLTPLGQAGKGAPQAPVPLLPLLPLPVLAAPVLPGAPEQAPAPVPSPKAEPPQPATADTAKTGDTATSPPSRRPEGPAPAPVASVESPAAARFKSGYAKASKKDRGCALPGHLAEERGAETRRPTIAVGTRVRVLAAANLRVAPFCDAKVKDVLEKGETVTVMGVFGSWYEVGRSGRSLGFVGASLLAGAKGR